MAFKLPNLAFEYHDLEPHIDAQTMEIHYTRHYLGYLNKFNDAIENTELETKTPSEIFSNISEYPDTIRDNGGGYFNHTLFWSVLTPHTHHVFNINLLDAIVQYFGTIEHLKEEFAEAALTQFGSGWAWLVKKHDGELFITSTPNQDNPLMDIARLKGMPILCLDVWEHAYYLKYQNRRADYIEAFWQVVNWQRVAELYNS